ncbi:MAG: hypothetical protein ACK4ZM_01540 [bacterium]
MKALIVIALILTLVSLQQACDISELFGFKFSGSSIVSNGGGGTPSSLDTSFGNNGFAIFDNNGYVDQANTMAIDNNFFYLAGAICYQPYDNTLLLRFFK